MHYGPNIICIVLKSYYASVECVYRELDLLKVNLLVADESRSDQTICLAGSPALEALGVPGRPRLFEATIPRYNVNHEMFNSQGLYKTVTDICWKVDSK